MRMKYYLLFIILSCCSQSIRSEERSINSIHLGSRESDPGSLVENVSMIYGDYTEIEVDIKINSPDSLVLSRYYSSQDTLQAANFGGWRLNPHCFLSKYKDSKSKSYTNTEGTFEQVCIKVGNPDGTILTYVGWQNVSNYSKRTLFKIDAEDACTGLVNTAKGSISQWTNLKNNELYFDPETESFELHLSTHGKRFYRKHHSLDIYLITHELLPSGNKLFYEFDQNSKLSFIKQTNASENKILAWIKIEYGNGIRVEASDGKIANYHFQKDTSGILLLAEVERSDKPNVRYEYQVIDKQPLLIKKTFPEGRFIEIDYYTNEDAQHKVKSIAFPGNKNEKDSIHFSYDTDSTLINGPGDRKSKYRFNERFQLIAIEQYLGDLLYRIHKKTWGIKNNAGDLISTSLQDGEGNIFYHKSFIYDRNQAGSIAQEREYGDVVGMGSIPLQIDEEGEVINQDGCIKNYYYFSGKTTYGFLQTDATGIGVKYWYKKGTNLLLKKFLLLRGTSNLEDEDYRAGIKERYFYTYNDDGALSEIIIDDGSDSSFKERQGFKERTITRIYPKQELPNCGAPEVIEHKYYVRGKSECLLKKIVNEFDNQGDIIAQNLYDSTEHLCYTVKKNYLQGLLVYETDPIGNETYYSYDENNNLISETHTNTGISIEYSYDLKNRLVYTRQSDNNSNQFETSVSYNALGNKLFEVDRYGYETTYHYDSLGRPIEITYHGVSNGVDSFPYLTYSYSYDLFDHPTIITDPKGNTLITSYNIHGKPIEINHLNGIKEVFKYDSGGNLHEHYGTDGLLQVFSYDYKGRLSQVDYYHKERRGAHGMFKKKIYAYNAFHKIFERDERGNQTNYSYDNFGRLIEATKEDQKVEFTYDSLGRMCGVKKWTSPSTFILEFQEYDFLDNIIEERIEDQERKLLYKKKYVYNNAGYLTNIIGYPESKESILLRYEYDGFGRLSQITNAEGFSSFIIYDDAYINELGQKGQKRTQVDPLGNATIEIFDLHDQLIEVNKKDSSGHLLTEKNIFYDHLGNKIAEKSLILDRDVHREVFDVGWTFNQLGQLKSYTLGKGTVEERITRFEYNLYGDIAAKYQPGSSEPITYRYDRENNLSAISFFDGKDKFHYELIYDRAKNITEVRLGSSCSINYYFNAHNMPVTERIKDKFGFYQVERIYNREGKIQTLKLPDGSFVEYSYEGPFIKSAIRFNKEKQGIYSYAVALRDQMGHILEETLPGHVGMRRQLWTKSGQKKGIQTDFFEDYILEKETRIFDHIKKRSTKLAQESYITDYTYNALGQLIAEKGRAKHEYFYDSIGNRLQKDGISYKVDSLNQILETGVATYTFDESGNMATKTMGGKSWIFKSNPLNQLISVIDPDQNKIKFTYDPSGKRLTKQIEIDGEKTKISRFFYLGDTEIGSIDEKGTIIELKIPSDPNNPEAPCIAIEVQQKIYVPLYDLESNIVSLVDLERCQVVETYVYSVYGEEKIINEADEIVSDSSVGNPWRYRGKRVDKECGLIYFGYRYYDAEVGRWISPDPAGFIDGPNLYAYAHNNPLTYIDYFGLNSSISEACGCTQHGHPGRGRGPLSCICICEKNSNRSGAGGYCSKIGSNIKNTLKGVSHGVVDFMIKTVHEFDTSVVYLGSAELEMGLYERAHMLQTVDRLHASQMEKAGDFMVNLFSIDQSDLIYQSARSTTTLGLEIGSLAYGVYGTVKGVISFSKLAKMPTKAITAIQNETSILKNVKKSNKIWSSTKKRSSVENAFIHWQEHGGDFPGLLNAKQYVESTKAFINNPPNGTLIKIRANRDIVFYHPPTNTFAISSPSGLPRTMYKPTIGEHIYLTNMEYFNAQK